MFKILRYEKYNKKGIVKIICIAILITIAVAYLFTIHVAGLLKSKSYQQLWSINLPYKSLLNFIGDINADGYNEIIISTDNDILILNATNGRVIKELNILKYNNKSSMWSIIAIIDVNIDKKADMIILSRYMIEYEEKSYIIYKIFCISSDNGDLLWISEYNVTDNLYLPKYNIINVNDDEVPDLIFYVSGFLYVIDCKNGSLIWKRQIENENYLILTGDTNGDGNLEVILMSAHSVYCFSIKSGKLYWNIKLSSIDDTYVYVRASIYDVDSDGNEEIIYATSDGHVGCIDTENNNPNHIWKNIITNGLYRLKIINVKDGMIGLLVFTNKGMYFLDSSNGSLLWTCSFHIVFDETDDINNDGIVEILGGDNTTFYYISAIDGNVIYTYNPNVESLLSKVYNSDISSLKVTIHTSIIWLLPKVYDINNDNNKEIIVVAKVTKYNKNGNFVIILNNRGQELGVTYIDSNTLVQDTQYIDIDGDGVVEVVLLNRDINPYPFSESHLYVFKYT
ncbi:MAG: PQQ-binding-like beta-propeller repeat protein [Candidatus Asgardarchaeum sp.]